MRYTERQSEQSGERLYLAYGSNLNLRRMRCRCPTARAAGKTELRGFELLFRRGVANVEPRENGRVPALVWTIRPRDEAALDAYEGFPNLYVKRDVSVTLKGADVTAMLYEMAPGYAAELPPRGYLDVIRQGYSQLGFSQYALNAALLRTIELIGLEQHERQERGAPENDFGMRRL